MKRRRETCESVRARRSRDQRVTRSGERACVRRVAEEPHWFCADDESGDRQVLLGADCVCAARGDSGTIERRAVQKRVLVR